MQYFTLLGVFLLWGQLAGRLERPPLAYGKIEDVLSLAVTITTGQT